MTALTPYVAVLRTRFTLLLQYRAAAIAGFGTQCWWGAIKVMVLAAFYRGAESFPMTLRQTVDYVWLGQAFLLLQPWGVDSDVVRMIRTGDVALERLRPVDTYAFWYARSVARRTATPLLRSSSTASWSARPRRSASAASSTAPGSRRRRPRGVSRMQGSPRSISIMWRSAGTPRPISERR